MSFISLSIYSLAVFIFWTLLCTTKTNNLRAGQLCSGQRLPTLQVRRTTGLWVCCKGCECCADRIVEPQGFSADDATKFDWFIVYFTDENDYAESLISAKDIFNEESYFLSISESDQRLLLLYQVTNRRALGVALGIIGLLVIMMTTYACVTWCHSDKRGYSIPPGQQKRSDNDENDSLYPTDTTSGLYYNR